MSEAAKPTPGELETDESLGNTICLWATDDPDGEPIARMHHDRDGISREEVEADAERLVMTWNCHDLLVSALQEAEAGLLFAGADKDIPEGRFVPSPTLALRSVRAALAKATTPSA